MNVLYLGPPEMRALVQDELPSATVHHANDSRAVGKVLPECAAVLDAHMKVPFPVERLEEAQNLEVFVTATTGADHIDAGHLEDRSIPLLTLRGQEDLLAKLTPAAEHSWLLLMACARGLPAAVDEVKQGRWEREDHPGTMLRGKTLGIVGCGRIGSWMGRYARAFEMTPLGYDPHADPFPDHIDKAPLENVLSNADFLTVHVPLKDETRGLIGRAELEKLREGTVVVNTSRGAVMDEHALLWALAEGPVARAGLDVLDGEPDIDDHPLVERARTHDDVIITPHIAGFSPESVEIVLAFSCERIRDHLDLPGPG